MEADETTLAARYEPMYGPGHARLLAAVDAAAAALVAAGWKLDGGDEDGNPRVVSPAGVAIWLQPD